MTATDFIPAVSGHPVVDQYLASMSLSWQQRASVRQAVDEMFGRLAQAGRPNNLATSMAAAICAAIYAVNDRGMTDADSDRYLLAVNDRLGAAPRIANMSQLEKQTLSDTLVFQATMIALLHQLGTRDPQARLQSIQLSHMVLQQLTGSPTGG